MVNLSAKHVKSIIFPPGRTIYYIHFDLALSMSLDWSFIIFFLDNDMMAQHVKGHPNADGVVGKRVYLQYIAGSVLCMSGFCAHSGDPCR